MSITTLLIDLDDTIYPPHSGLWSVIGKRIEEYMRLRLGFPEEEIQPCRIKYFTTYGTTLRGLKANYHIDEDDYLAFVHDVPLEQYIEPDARLRLMFEQILCKKIIFTNADRHHAERVLDIMGLTDCFDRIIDVKSVSPHCKPIPEAYVKALELISESPEHCIFFDDSLKNIIGAEKAGIRAVHVNQKEQDSHFPRIASIIDIPEILARLSHD